MSKLKPPVSRPPAAEDLEQGERQLVDRVRELVGVPTVLRVTAVGVDAAEDAVVDGVRHLVVEAVTGERGVVHLDVDVVLAEQVVPVEEAVHRGGVVVVLVLRRLLRLRLEQQLAGEPDRALVVGDEVQEASELVVLACACRC